MSFRASEWAYGLRELSGPEKAVLLCLAWHHNGKTGLCCPGTALIAEETCLGLSTVKKALKSLEGRGLIARTPWRRGSAYMLAIVEPEKATTEPAHIEQEANRKERKGSDWKERRPVPMSDYRARAEKRIAETRELTKPVEDDKTPEERAAVVERALALLRSPQGALPRNGEVGSAVNVGVALGLPGYNAADLCEDHIKGLLLGRRDVTSGPLAEDGL